MGSHCQLAGSGSISRRRMEDICDGEGLVDYGKRKRVGAGHRRGGTGRRRQRRSWSASDGGVSASGGAIWRLGGGGEAGRGPVESGARGPGGWGGERSG